MHFPYERVAALWSCGTLLYWVRKVSSILSWSPLAAPGMGVDMLVMSPSPGLHRYVTEPLTGSIMTISDLDTHWKCTTLAIKLTLRTKITLSDVTMICSFTAISLIAGSLKRHFHVMHHCPLYYTISSIRILI